MCNRLMHYHICPPNSSISTLVSFFSMLLPSFLRHEAQSGRVAYGCHGKSRTEIPYRISKYRCLTLPQELHSVRLFLYLISLIVSIPFHLLSADIAVGVSETIPLNTDNSLSTSSAIIIRCLQSRRHRELLLHQGNGIH